MFYPADPDELAHTVDSLLAAAGGSAAGGSAATGSAVTGSAVAYVVPHAGYRYSGPTAARAYARLGAAPAALRRIVLVGPAHLVPMHGCAVPSTPQWSTPLGVVDIDVDGCVELVRAGHAIVDDEPHAPEHSLEVQLPFLQRVLPPEVRVLPIAVGPSTVEHVAGALGAAVGPPTAGTVVLCSTDLSHYLDEASAQAQDAQTVAAILALAPERIGVRDACGVFALRGLLGWARAQGLHPDLLHRCTSADATGDRSRVVGYSAVAFAPGGQR